jgi:transposase
VLTPSTGFITLEEEVRNLRMQVQDKDQVIRSLEQKNAWLTKVVYGPRSERRPVVQDHGLGKQESFLEAPVEAVAVVAPPTEAPAAPEADADTSAQAVEKAKRNAKKGLGPDGKKKARNGGGRRPVNMSLRPVEVVIAAPESERVAADGTQLVLLGYETSEREAYISAELVREIIKRERWGLPDTREVAYIAPPPPAIVPKGKYADSVLVEAMYRKYVILTPFTRMLADFRAMGSDLSDAQLSDLARRFAEFFSPVAEAIRTQVLARAFVHVDETPLPTLDGRRTIWAWVGGNQAFFHIGGRGGRELRRVLGLDTDGDDEPDPGPGATLGWAFSHWMADGYRPYDTIAAEARITRLCCWAHARRDFVIPADEGDPVAQDLITRIRALYQVEKDAGIACARTGLHGASADAERHRRRQAEALPILAGIREACQQALPRYDHDQKGRMRLALSYILDRWSALTAYTARGDLPIDNNQAERVLRPIVIGRKNWYFVGSEDATAWAATNFTIFESCRLAKIEPRVWLRSIIARLHAGDRDYAAMTPAAYATRATATA